MSQSPSASKSTPPGIERGRKYRFVVSSAEEAIETLRERLGAEAKVLSVKQVDGQGLSRFLKSPRLEIVATVPEQGELPELEPVEDETPPQAKMEQAKTAKTAPAKAAEKKSPAPALDDPLRAELESD
ncbi:MAG: hypothetical protein JW942_02950, partial [Opitutales bacterium]|nr:hypothetical protein [Opitutales bacterium]